MKRKAFVVTASIGVAVVCFAASVFAQSTFGTILGTATDSSGAVIPNIVVKITNQGENTSREYRTDGEGNYQAENLKEGIYTVAAQTQGFKEITVKDIRLTARQIVRTDLKLAVGATTENVTVFANAELINTESPAISTSATSVEVLDLPANYRGAGSTSPITLLPFLPGITGDKYGQVSVQGTGVNQVEYTIDGISTTNVRYSGPQTEMFPSVESISEIKVQGSGNDAEYGQASDITTTSKSGTNAFHGSLFEYFQNAALDAEQTGTLRKPAKSANTFGGSFSGPIVKNHTFFFADYEGMRYRTSTPQAWTVPTQAMRNGNFTGIAQIHDLDGTPFPNDTIPSNRISSVANQILPFYPLPNKGDPNVFQANNFVENFPNPTLSDQFDVRIDHTLTSKQNLFGRWTYKNKRNINPNYADMLLPSDRDSEHDNQIVIAHNYAITSNLINELRGGLSRGNNRGTFPFNGPAFMQKLGLNPQELGPFPAGGFPQFAFETSGISRIFHSRPPAVLSNNFQINENLTWTKGKHTLKFGFDFRRLHLTDVWSSTAADDYGDFYFNGGYFTGHDFSDFLVGVPYFTYVTHTPPNIDGKSTNYYGFAQDSFKVNQKLTLDFGVRISRLSPFIDPINHTNFDPSVPGTGRVIISSDPRSLAATQPLFAQNINACNTPHQVNLNPDPTSPCTPFLTAKEAGWPEGLRKTYTDFSPRIGFAFRPFTDNKTVIRGGIGIYTITTLGAVFYSVAGIHDGFQASYFNSAFGQPGFFQFPNVESSATLYGLGLGTQRFETANQFDKKDPYSIQWNLTAERVLHGNTVMRVSYIANRAVQLTWGPDLNQPLPSTTPYSSRPRTDRPFPDWSNVYTRAGGAVSTYESMQTELVHKYSHGVTFQSTWTWARNLADTESWPRSVFSGEVTGRSMNRLNLKGDYGNVGGTRTHRWITSLVDELPIGRGRALLGNANGVLNGFLGGWRLSTIFLFQTGPYDTPFIFFDSSGMNAFNRPDVIGNPNISNPTPGHWWNASAFVCPGQGAFTPNSSNPNQLDCSNAPTVGRFGNSGVGTLIGPKTVNLSVGLAKDFHLTERFKLKLESSFTNVPNHVNWDDPANSVTDSNFGQTALARRGDAGGNRVGQLALRIEF
jgi:hypothetical protein